MPHKLAPQPTLLQHALFAIKHEGMRLHLLAAALRRIPPAELVEHIRVARFINERYDVRSGDLTTLIVTIFQNGGVLSSNRRKRFADRVQPQAMDAIEQAVSQAMQGLPLTP